MPTSKISDDILLKEKIILVKLVATTETIYDLENT
jgi:hypothetical protein